jgi:hypothetical protein
VTPRLALLLLAALALSAPAARAGPPFVTDDPEIVPYEHWEIYLASQLNHDPGGWSGTSPHLDLNYGVFPDVQLNLVAPVAFDAPVHGATHFGYGDTELAVKYRFVQETDLRPQICIYPRVVLPTGNDAQGLGSGHVQGYLPVLLEKSWGEPSRLWTAYGGGGYWIHPGSGNRDWGFAGALLQRRLTDRLTLGLEAFHQTAQEKDRHGATWLNAGGIVDFGETWHLLLSAGHNVQGASGFQAYVALQATFGPP